MSAIWEERVMGVPAPPELFARSGLAQVEAFIGGEAPPPPLHYLTGMRPTAASPGRSEFQMPAIGGLASPTGQILGGALAILADGPLGCAIQTCLPPGTAYTTTELSMSYLRPAHPDGRMIRARGHTVHVGRTLALSEVAVEDADGRQLAHGTSRCFVFPPIEVPDPPPPLPPVEEPQGEPPFERPPAGDVTPAAAWRELAGLEIARRWVDGRLTPPPIHYLTGQRPVDADDGRCKFSMPASEWLTSPTGYVEGGALVMVADSAVLTAVQTTLPPGTAYAPVDITVRFVRPAPADGRELIASASVVHRGRSLAVAEAHVHNADGKLVCVAIGSALILPGRDMAAIAAEDASVEAE